MTTKRKLLEFVYSIAYCPCCTGVTKCSPECTYEEDSKAIGREALIRYEQMIAARAALRGE